LADLLKDDAESVLVQVVARRVVLSRPTNDQAYAATVSLNQFGFGLPIAGTDAADEISKIARTA
jgi:hypothetical protein